MIKKSLFLAVFMAIELHAVVKTTKILDFEYHLDTQTVKRKRFINKTDKKMVFRYTLRNPKNGDFVKQEPILVQDGFIEIDFADLGKEILPSVHGRVKVSIEVSKVIQTPDKKMDELCACRFKNGKKDLLISSHQFDKNETFELYFDSVGHLACKSDDLVE